jgi:hypothetical protein
LPVAVEAEVVIQVMQPTVHPKADKVAQVVVDLEATLQ